MTQEEIAQDALDVLEELVASIKRGEIVATGISDMENAVLGSTHVTWHRRRAADLSGNKRHLFPGENASNSAT